MRVTCVVKRYEHHSVSGGYDRLATVVGANIIEPKQIRGLYGRAANKIWQYLTAKDDSTDYDYRFGDWLAELQALATSVVRPPDVLHILNGTQLNLVLKWRSLLRCPLIVTFHAASDLPYQRFKNYPKGLNIDIAVVVATSQIIRMRRLIEPQKIVYIPHGIDTDRFQPGGQKLDLSKMRVLIVGDHMRDWLVIHKVIDEINLRGLDVEFHVVTHVRNFSYLIGCSNLIYHSGISETQLIGLYRNTDVLFLPLTNATANNSILEALACGTPVISTSVGGVPDYVNDESGWLLPVGDVVGHANLIASLHSNRELARNRRQAARIPSAQI